MTFAFDPIWWIGAVEIPAVAALFWLVWRTRRDLEAALEADRRHVAEIHAGMAAALADFKLDVAKSYASVAYLNAVERRLAAHLFRIEAKLDGRPVRPPAGDALP
jgi:hypothetical protein